MRQFAKDVGPGRIQTPSNHKRVPGRKIRIPEGIALDDLGDRIVMASAAIEQAYVEAGIKNYTAKECFDKGFQIALGDYLQEDSIVDWTY